MRTFCHEESSGGLQCRNQIEHSNTMRCTTFLRDFAARVVIGMPIV